MEHNQIHFRVEFTIEEGKIEEYKKLIQEMSRVVEDNEPDTINYQFYLNRSETKCIAHKTYANSEAALAHNTGVASQTILPKIFSISRITSFDVYGNPSEELQKVLASLWYTDFQFICGVQSLTVREIRSYQINSTTYISFEYSITDESSLYKGKLFSSAIE